MQHVPACTSSRTLPLFSSTADYHSCQIPTIRASSSFCLRGREESLFSRCRWNLSIQQTNLCSPLLLSTPSTSRWALQLPRALHCKQPLCCHPPVPQTVGSFSCFHWLWGRNKWSPELVKQPLINPELELIKLQTSGCDDTFIRKPSLCYQLLKYRHRDVGRDLEAPLDTNRLWLMIHNHVLLGKRSWCFCFRLWVSVCLCLCVPATLPQRALRGCSPAPRLADGPLSIVVVLTWWKWEVWRRQTPTGGWLW